ncbi:DUF1749-domain-containing protein [Cryphonectria parasitica EP155]|uniref:DUF1749-domain-containing protein n=1 Tax=Cryphonectria parasitica (strain ATCC 38755 / EP155) TaxID=660469 RepID=A0A9P4YAS2_CRYP1|nr:DUF1749-domain-containing protein [Cryphonectria parasitica EP155]KAF3769921.1 DUF1749-domain-containing protein [Cryphonectria parasitica EP155]
MATSQAAPFSVRVHPYESRGVKHAHAYELGSSSAQNALIFVGGLMDGPHTVPYIRTVAEKIESTTGLNYSVFEIRIRSSFSGFGWASLADDVEDISALVKYLRSIGKEKVVLMGHSTGCQDCMEYNKYAKYGNEPVDGFIIQAPVSDREAYVYLSGQETTDSFISTAKEMINAGNANDAVPRSRLPPDFPFECPLTAYRLHSLAAVGGDDDFFSSDLPDDQVAAIWGLVQKPILIVPSAEDEYVPTTVNREELLVKWKSNCPKASDLSALIPGAGHTVDPPPSQEWLAERVVSFLKSLEKRD